MRICEGFLRFNDEQTISGMAGKQSYVAGQQNTVRNDLALLSIFRVFWFHSNVIIVMIVFGLLASLMVYFYLDKEYKSEVILELNHIPQNFRTSNILREKATTMHARIQNTMAFASSGRFFRELANSLDVYADPMFVGSLIEPESNRASLPHRVATLGGRWLPSAGGYGPLIDVGNAVIDSLVDSVVVSQRGVSNILAVEVTFAEPGWAAAIANRAAAILVTDEAERLKVAEARSFDWLTRKVNSLRDEVTSLEGEILSLALKHNLHGVDEELLISRLAAIQLSEFTTRLAQVKAERADLVARYASTREGIESNGAEYIAATAKSPALDELKRTEISLERLLAELRSDLGEKHPQVIGTRDDLDRTRQRMMEEAYRIHNSLRGELLVSIAREEELQVRLTQITEGITEERKEGVALYDLRNRAAQKKIQLEILLEKQKSLLQKRMLRRQNAAIVSPASLPSDHEFPKLAFLALYLSTGGGVIGLVGVFLFERWVADFGFKSRTDLQRAGLSALGIVPELDKREVCKMPLADHIVEHPRSMQAEGVQRIRGQLGRARIDPAGDATVVLVASSSPSDGKSSISLALARQSALAGERTLLIDANLRRSNVHALLGVTAKSGLGDFLSGAEDDRLGLDDDPLTSLKVLQAGTPHIMMPDIFFSEKMAELVRKMRCQYDWIFLDSPPLDAVADSLVLAGQADVTIYIAQWLATTRNVALSGVQRLHDAGANLGGVVLNRVDMSYCAKYEGLEEFKHYGYYQNNTDVP